MHCAWPLCAASISAELPSSSTLFTCKESLVAVTAFSSRASFAVSPVAAALRMLTFPIRVLSTWRAAPVDRPVKPNPWRSTMCVRWLRTGFAMDPRNGLFVGETNYRLHSHQTQRLSHP